MILSRIETVEIYKNNAVDDELSINKYWIFDDGETGVIMVFYC